jgi:hypothetical protein
MRSWFCIAVSALISLAIVPAAYPQRIDPGFLKARQARIEALSKGDKAAFERYTAEEFIVTGPTGAVENKAQRVARADHAQPQPEKFDNEKMTPYGDDTVILTWSQPGQGGGTGARFLEVWVKERGMWKVAAVQITPIQAGGGGGRGRGN